MRPIKFTKKEWGGAVLAASLALASLRPSDPWVFLPMLAASWGACLYLAHYHQGARSRKTLFVGVATAVLAFVAYRNIFRPGQPEPTIDISIRNVLTGEQYNRNGIFYGAYPTFGTYGLVPKISLKAIGVLLIIEITNRTDRPIQLVKCNAKVSDVSGRFENITTMDPPVDTYFAVSMPNQMKRLKDPPLLSHKNSLLGPKGAIERTLVFRRGRSTRISEVEITVCDSSGVCAIAISGAHVKTDFSVSQIFLDDQSVDLSDSVLVVVD